jgi:hypothetical protein
MTRSIIDRVGQARLNSGGAGPGAGGAQQALLRVDGHRPAASGCGAPRPQRAARAGSAEGHRPVLAHLPGDPGGAGDRALVLADGEVIQSEPAGHGRAQRTGLDHGVVVGVMAGGAGLPAA